MFQNGNTLLHLACRSGQVDVISYLLRTGKVDPIAHNNAQEKPLEQVHPDHPNRFKIFQMFEPFEKSRLDYPVDSYSKIFFCGHKTAGKSSLTQCIKYRADKPADHNYDPFECIDGVQLETAGINYHNVQSNEIGNIILYDFAGHQEYYSSHAAVLQNLMLRIPGVFTIVVDLTQGLEYFRKQLLYWFYFIENVCNKLAKPSQIIVVGSHVDSMTDSYEEFQSDADSIAEKAIRKQQYRGFVAVDCHRPGGKGFSDFIAHLCESSKAVLDKSETISYYCHVQYSYLQKLQKVAICLKELSESLKGLNDPSLPSDETVLLGHLSVLSDKGLVLFLKNEPVSNSWIIVNKSKLLAEVNGVIFNQTIKRIRKPTSSNTGIVPVSIIRKLFPAHDASMLISFLLSMEFCHDIDSDTLKIIDTNLSSSDKLSTSEVLLYFPALITAEPPSNLNESFKYGFGWCLYCSNPNEFLSVRFLHVLLLRLAYLYCLPRGVKVGELNTKSPLQQLAVCCTVWKNGIFWKRNVNVVVEVTDHNRCVTVFVSGSDKIESQKTCSSVIKRILQLQKELCPCTISEFIIPPGSLDDIRNKEITQCIFYSINDIARGMLVNEEIFDNNRVKDSPINVRHICPIEPYISLAPAVINALFAKSKADQRIPERYLQHVKEFAPSVMSICQDSTYSTVASHLNDYSLFTGRNPLVCYYYSMNII